MGYLKEGLGHLEENNSKVGHRGRKYYLPLSHKQANFEFKSNQQQYFIEALRATTPKDDSK